MLGFAPIGSQPLGYESSGEPSEITAVLVVLEGVDLATGYGGVSLSASLSFNDSSDSMTSSGIVQPLGTISANLSYMEIADTASANCSVFVSAASVLVESSDSMLSTANSLSEITATASLVEASNFMISAGTVITYTGFTPSIIRTTIIKRGS